MNINIIDESGHITVSKNIVNITIISGCLWVNTVNPEIDYTIFSGENWECEHVMKSIIQADIRGYKYIDISGKYLSGFVFSKWRNLRIVWSFESKAIITLGKEGEYYSWVNKENKEWFATKIPAEKNLSDAIKSLVKKHPEFDLPF